MDPTSPRNLAAPRPFRLRSVSSDTSSVGTDSELDSLRSDGMRKSLSSQSLDEMDDVNTSWVGGKGTWCIYIGGIVACRMLLHCVNIQDQTAWTALNLFHAVFTFYYLHWLKGAPMFKGTADYNEKCDRFTFWEQLDNGMQYTLNKKFLTIIPIVLFLLTISNCGDQLGLCGLQYHLRNIITRPETLGWLRFTYDVEIGYTQWRAPSVLNLLATICTLVPKSPLMHGKRVTLEGFFVGK